MLSLVDSAGQVISSFETWPGWGTMPHPWMQHHTDYQDEYFMRIPPDAAGSEEIYLDIRWYVFPDGPDLKAVLESGREAESLVLPLGTLVGD